MSTAARYDRLLTISLARLGILVGFFLLWEFVARQGLINPILIGTPSGIATYLYREIFVTGSLWIDIYWTAVGTLGSFLLGSAAGILCGMLFISRPTLELILEPFMSALNSTPRLALAPLFVIWFGLGVGSKIAVGASLSFFIVLTNTVAGGRSVNPDHLTLARTLGASKGQVFLKFIVPGAVPVIFNGLRLGLIFSLLGVIGTEILAAQYGLGQRLTVLAAGFRTNGVFGIIILLAIMGMSINVAMSFLERKLLRWT